MTTLNTICNTYLAVECTCPCCGKVYFSSVCLSVAINFIEEVVVNDECCECLAGSVDDFGEFDVPEPYGLFEGV